jgi:oxygen-independent coproporphyrinogen-3 oxidase
VAEIRFTGSTTGGISLAALPPLALYLHVPWCVRKCPYCDFNSHEATGAVPEEQFLAALERDLEAALPLVWGRKVYTVFFGGGTPSLLSARAVEGILSAVRARFQLDPAAEVTLEANPGTAEAQKFAGYRAAGVNRLSLGIQSFDPRCLRALGRIHDGREALAAVEMARRHFDNFNLDLMHGLPGQTAAEAESDIAQALAFDPPHLSAYQLTIEPNTAFHRAPPELPGEPALAEIEAAFQERLASRGYRRYETSAYARAGSECRHNLNYWRFGDYLGVGPGAHSKLSFPDRVLRQVRPKNPREYLARAGSGNPVQSEQEVAAADLPFEFMMNALRLTEGFPAALFEERTGLPITVARGPLDMAAEKGLIERDGLRIAPTELGRRFLNDLLQLFLNS